jgi:acetate kinase
MGTTLIVNPGSSSRKYALYRNGSLLLELRYEDTDTGFEVCTQLSGGQQACSSIEKDDFLEATAHVSEEVDKCLAKESVGRVDSVVIRVVAPGTYFQQHCEITQKYIQKLKEKESVSPLHIPIIIKEIEGIKKHFKTSNLWAASDSAFHKDMPRKAREYSINSDDAKTYDIFRFGFHGLSVSSVVRKIHPLIGIEPEKMVICHIGSGVSVTAVKEGKSVETTMGFSPTSGLPMGSRAGDLDAVALLELIRVKNLRPNDAEVYINTNGGLVGISGESDIRRLLDQRSQGNEEALNALDKFTYSIKKAIASSTVALGGLDVLVLTATASVRSSELRCLILKDLEYLGIHVNQTRNEMMVGRDGVISVRNSPVKVVVMRTDEMGEMNIVANELSQKVS